MTHPLTDEICEGLANTEDRPFTDIEMDNMRAAADWQLEQVVKALNQCKEEKRSCIEVIYLFHEKLEAMRPTKTQEDS
jgi:hypothetical protein